MPVDPLRALFLELGVDDKKGILALSNITRAANNAERALLGVAEASKLAGGVSNLTRSNTALAASYNAVAAGARRAALDTFYLARANFQVNRGQTVVNTPSGAIPAGFGVLARQSAEVAAGRMQAPWSAWRNMAGMNAAGIGRLGGPGPYMPGYPPAGRTGRAGRGNFGLGTSVFLAGLGISAGAYGFQQGAGLERTSLLASYASGQSPAAMRRQSVEIARRFNLRLPEATALTQEVAQLGAMSPEGQRQIARAGAGFHTMETGVQAGEASAAIYRLIKATSRSKEEFDQGTAAAMRYAGAIYAAGNESAAGAKEVFSMVQEIEPLAQMMHLGANGTIALSAAFADLNENQRELFRGALTRMTIQGKLDPNNPIGSLLAIADRLRAAGSDAQKLNILKAMGFNNIRDVQTISVMAASMDTFARSWKAVNEELTGTSTFETKVGSVLGTLSGQWDGFKSSMDSAAASIVGSLTPALSVLLSVLSGLAAVISDNPALQLLLGAGAVGLAGMGVRGAYRRHFAGDAAVRMAALGLEGPRGALRHGRLTENLMGVLPFLGRGRAESFAATRTGMALAEGAGLGRGLGRMNRLSLGLMKMLPFGEGLAIRAAGIMGGEGIGGMALRAATGPVGWILTALSVGAPLFEKIGKALNSIARQGGMLGIVFNTLGLIFDVIAAGGRILNKAFGWIFDVGGKVWHAIGGDVLTGGVNNVLQGLHGGISGIAASPETKAGAQTPSRAPSVVTNIYTGGSQSGYQSAIDEVSRRAARSMPANSYGGLAVT